MLNTLYLFGAYRLEPGKGLFRGERQVPVPPKELELLCLLLSLEGRVASHEKIEATLWPRQLVSYASLARCVYSLRKILDAEGETYIQTVPRRGYRLIAPVKQQPIDAPASARAQSVKTTPLAYSHFLEGLREANRPYPENQDRAIHLYQEALRVDPTFASAYAAIADTRLFQMIRGYVKPAEGLKLARSACEKALELTPFLTAAGVALAWLEGTAGGAPSSALASLDQALAHDPDYARGYTYRSWLLRALGRAEESVAAVRQAVELDPHSIWNRHSLAWGLFLGGQAEQALAMERELRVIHRRDDVAFIYLAVISAYLDLHEEALDATFEALRLSRANPAVQSAAAYVLARVGESDEARELLKEAEAAELPRAVRTLLAPAYTQLGDYSYALDLLETARDERCVWLLPARLDPRLAPLADEPRFVALFK